MAIIVKDSLGLGIKKIINKEKIYTDDENAAFTRQVLSESENEQVKNNLLSIEEVREIIIENCNKETYDNIDYELLIAIDSRINYNVYLISDNIYDYKSLCMAYPFQEFNILPESVFNRQIIAYFDNNKIEVMNEGDPIISTYDLIKISNKKISTFTEMSKVDKMINSKIFIGGEKWKDFLQLHGFFRGMVQISTLQIDNGQTPEFLKPFTAAICSQLMISNNPFEKSLYPKEDDPTPELLALEPPELLTLEPPEFENTFLKKYVKKIEYPKEDSNADLLKSSDDIKFLLENICCKIDTLEAKIATLETKVDILETKGRNSYTK